MKNAIIFLLFLTKISVAEAQDYLIKPMPPSMSGVYGYKIEPNPGTGLPFNNGTLVAWFFPDGQYRQKIIVVSMGTVTAGTDTVQWSPYIQDAPSGPDYIQAYVARKGGTVNPSRAVYSSSWDPVAPAPAPVNFRIGKTWQVDRSWDLSPKNETFLIVSYNPTVGCLPFAGDFIELHVDPPTQLLYEDNYAFNSELIIPNPGLIQITNLSCNPVHKQVFLKMKTKDDTRIGDTIKITAIGKFCSPITDTVVLQYVTRGAPHDPNKKTVGIAGTNLLAICDSQYSAVKLIYSVQFHNDGIAPVKKVVVTDILPPELDPATFHLVTPPILNGIDGHVLSKSGVNNEIIDITFTGVDPVIGLGLPGLGQTNPTYSYDQTIYGFTFEVWTKAGFQTQFDTIIDNIATVVFYDNQAILPSISTNVASVIVINGTLDCFSSFSPTSEAPDLLSNINIGPNPFQDQIDISFELMQKSKLSIEVRDIWGNLVASVVSGECASGAHQFIYDGKTIPDGVYLIILRTEKESIAKRVIKI